MTSTLIALLLAATAAQSDTTRASREAFTGCLRTYVNRAVQDQKTLETFRTEYPQQCTTQEAAFRQSVINRESALRATRANAEEQAQLEIEDARTNFRDRFEMPVPEQPQQQPAQPPAQQPQPQPQQPAQPQPPQPQ